MYTVWYKSCARRLNIVLFAIECADLKRCRLQVCAHNVLYIGESSSRSSYISSKKLLFTWVLARLSLLHTQTTLPLPLFECISTRKTAWAQWMDCSLALPSVWTCEMRLRREALTCLCVWVCVDVSERVYILWAAEYAATYYVCTFRRLRSHRILNENINIDAHTNRRVDAESTESTGERENERTFIRNLCLSTHTARKHRCDRFQPYTIAFLFCSLPGRAFAFFGFTFI